MRRLQVRHLETSAAFSDTINFGQSGSLTLNLKALPRLTTVRTETIINTGIERCDGADEASRGTLLSRWKCRRSRHRRIRTILTISLKEHIWITSRTPAAKTQPIIKSYISTTNDGKTITRIYLNKIDNTVRLQLPYVMSLQTRLHLVILS